MRFLTVNYLLKIRILKGIVLLLAIVTISSIFGAILYNHSKHSVEISTAIGTLKEFELSADASGIVINNPKFYGYDENKQRFYISSTQGREIKKDVYLLTDIHSDFYVKDSMLSLQADEAELIKELDKLLLKGAVTVVSDNGYSLHSKSANINLRNKSAEGYDDVVLKSEHAEIYADAFKISEHAEEIIFTGENGVKAFMMINQE